MPLEASPSGIPRRVAVMLGDDEPPLAHVVGRHDSGVVLTPRRLLAWRVNGVSPPLALGAVDRILYDRGPTDALVILPRAAAHVPLVVMIPPEDRARGEALVTALRDVVTDRATSTDSRVVPEEGDFLGIRTVRFRRA